MQQSRVERYLSPLRYPGGKASIAPMLGDMFTGQMSEMPIEIWIEPFAGGAGAALNLVERGAVDEAWLVDANPAIAAFWATVLADGEHLATQVERTIPTMRLWERSRTLLEMADSVDTYELAFAAFIVNRCSRSGIVAPRSGPIGGRAQDGRWTLASRFNGPALADRIRRVHALRSRLRSHYADGIRFIEDVDEAGICEEVVFFVDPPYLREGNRLYAHGMDRAAHQRLATALNGTAARWLLTYDNHPDVATVLYPERRVIPFGIRNTANRARQATELAVLSDNLNSDAFNLPDAPIGEGLVATA